MYYRSHILRSLALLALITLAYGDNVLLKVRGQARPSPQSQSRPRRAGEPQPTPTPSSSREGEVSGQDEVVRVETNLTNILFTVVDKNKRFITTLRQEDVRVLEDGVPQEIFTFQRETDRPLSLAILIDASVSQMMTLPGEKAAARAFVDSIVRSQKDQVAVVSFTGEATVEQELTADVGRVRRAIDRVDIVLPPEYAGALGLPGGSPTTSGSDPRMGTTAIWDAVWATSQELLSGLNDQKRRAIILLTDGVDTSSRMKRSEAIDNAVKADTVVYAIGIGDSYNFHGVEEDTLRKLSERTGGRAYFPKDGRDLRMAFAQIEQELRSQYLVAYSPTNKARDGSYRKVLLEVLNPALRKEKLRLTYRPGYFARTAATPQAAKP